MKINYLLALIPLIASIYLDHSWAYPINISRYENEGSMYVESSTIVRSGRFVNLQYVENYGQEKYYGQIPYWSKATNIRIDCQSRRVYALNESFYTEADQSGKLLASFPLNDEFGSYAEHGSWVSQVVGVGCKFQ
jgi:hypothetical protein